MGVGEGQGIIPLLCVAWICVDCHVICLLCVAWKARNIVGKYSLWHPYTTLRAAPYKEISWNWTQKDLCIMASPYLIWEQSTKQKPNEYSLKWWANQNHTSWKVYLSSFSCIRVTNCACFLGQILPCECCLISSCSLEWTLLVWKELSCVFYSSILQSQL